MPKKKLSSEELKAKWREQQRRYYEQHKNDPEYKAKINEYNRRSREKRIAEKTAKMAEFKKKTIKTTPVPESELVVNSSGEKFPAESIIAAAINQKNKFSRVIAEGKSLDNCKTVIVERTKTPIGIPCYRVKTTVYVYCKTKETALAVARAERVKLLLYGCDLHDDEGGDPMIVEEIMNDIS